MKMKRQPAAKTVERPAAHPWQHAHIDFGFIGQTSKNQSKSQKLHRGLKGETCCVVIKDRHTDTVDGECFVTKSLPIAWLDRWLRKHAPTCPDVTIAMDQGGELCKHPKVVNILKDSGCNVCPTGADAPHQNGHVERENGALTGMVSSVLAGSDMTHAFW